MVQLNYRDRVMKISSGMPTITLVGTYKFAIEVSDVCPDLRLMRSGFLILGTSNNRQVPKFGLEANCSRLSKRLEACVQFY